MDVMRTEDFNDKKVNFDIEIDMSYVSGSIRKTRLISSGYLILERHLTDREIKLMDNELDNFFTNFFDSIGINYE